MYLLMRIIFPSWLMTYLVKQSPTYFLLKLFSKRSLVAKNLPTELEMQIPYPSHRSTRSTWSRGSQGWQSLHCTAEKTCANKIEQNGKQKSSLRNSSLNWKTDLWLAEEAEIEIGHVEKWFMLLDNVIHVAAGTEEISSESNYWMWHVVPLDKGKVLKGKMLSTKLLESAKKVHEKHSQRSEKRCRER